MPPKRLSFLGYQRCLPTCAIIRLKQNYARPEISRHVFPLFCPFFFFHFIVDSHPIPKPLVEGLFLYFSFCISTTRKAGYENQEQLIVSLTKVVSWFRGMEGLVDRGVYSGVMLFFFFFLSRGKQLKSANNQSHSLG